MRQRIESSGIGVFFVRFLLSPLYSCDRSALPNIRTWALGHNAESALFSEEPIHAVDKDRSELD